MASCSRLRAAVPGDVALVEEPYGLLLVVGGFAVDAGEPVAAGFSQCALREASRMASQCGHLFTAASYWADNRDQQRVMGV